jgi:hypothetical protein
MTPKSKALNLILDFLPIVKDMDMAKNCAIKSVDLMIGEFKIEEISSSSINSSDYYEEVKKEINNFNQH